jgi:hypothetical protein
MSDLLTICRQEYYSELTNSLPPPVSDTPEHRERRLTTAIKAFDALRPSDAYEGRLAVQIVLCGAHAAECLLEASVYREDFSKRSRCRAQANSLMREERAAKQILAREQKVRLAAEAVAGTAPKLAPVPPAEAPLRPAVTQDAAPPVQPASAPPPSPEAIAQAEAFAEEAMDAAAQVRHDGGVTPQAKAYFYEVAFPTDPAVIDALVRGTSELLILLDEVCCAPLDEAA